MFIFQLTTKTGIDEEGIFYLRPLFYPSNSISKSMKYGLSPSNFKPRYESFKNPFHPFVAQQRIRYTPLISSQDTADKHDQLNKLPSIFDHAMIVDRITKTTSKENRKINPGLILESISSLISGLVASVQGFNSHCAHAMALECIYKELIVNANGRPILNWNGRAQYDYSFKFKNTDKNNKEIEIRAGTRF